MFLFFCLFVCLFFFLFLNLDNLDLVIPMLIDASAYL